jgi:fatty-acyl-CoA synthase
MFLSSLRFFVSPRYLTALFSRATSAMNVSYTSSDEKYGEEIKAFVVLHPGEKAAAEEIVAFCQAKLPNFLLPKYVVFLEAMPKSLVGKILKTELRKM